MSARRQCPGPPPPDIFPFLPHSRRAECLVSEAVLGFREFQGAKGVAAVFMATIVFSVSRFSSGCSELELYARHTCKQGLPGYYEEKWHCHFAPNGPPTREGGRGEMRCRPPLSLSLAPRRRRRSCRMNLLGLSINISHLGKREGGKGEEAFLVLALPACR